MNAQTWPEVLIVKFIPQNLLQKLKEFFANSIWMTFNFGQNAEKTALYSLYEQLTKVFLISGNLNFFTEFLSIIKQVS